MANYGFVTYYEAKQKLDKEFKQQIYNKIIELCESHKIRLTPKEYDQLVNEYINTFIENISVVDIIKIAEFIERRNSWK